MRSVPLFETPWSALAGSHLWTSPVLVLDAQATAANPARGDLIEIGWASTAACSAASLPAEEVWAQLIAAPRGLPPAVARVTGLRAADLATARDARAVWRALEDRAGRLGAAGPVPAIVHFARYEEPFLRDLFARHGRSPAFPLHLVCTHAIARRLLPDLPRRSLRALTGYLGRSVPPLRRSAEHVQATAFVWHHLAGLVADQGVGTFGDLTRWLEHPAPRGTHVYPMPRERRLGVADAPGVYRLLRANGDVLYVGKAGSLRRRVNSHFTGHSGRHERSLEMLTQARDLACTPTETALEAALLEADEIKRLQPPYNVALAVADRAVWFSAADFSSVHDRPDDTHTVGPFSLTAPPEALGAFVGALSGGPPSAAVRGRCLGVDARWAPDAQRFAAGLARFLASQPSLSRAAGPRELLRAGAALWRARLDQGCAPETADELVLTPPADARWSAARVEEELAESLLRATRSVRRSRWLCRLAESSISWTEPRGRRLLVIEKGEVARREWIGEGAPVPLPPGQARTMAERRAGFDLGSLDRLRVLATELRRLVAEASAVEVTLGAHAALDRRRLSRVLAWV